MKKTINETYIEGYLFEHDLKKKISGKDSKNPGTVYITGTIGIATDEELLNVVPVHFSYVTEVTKQGSKNATFEILNSIIENKLSTVMQVGKESAGKVKVNSAIGLNEFYDNSNRLVSVKRNEGGFVHQISALNEDEKMRNTFKCDVVITNTKFVEPDEEKQTEGKLIVKGAIFDFKKAILPVEFSVTNSNAIDYFESLEASSSKPVFTKIWGRQISEVVVKKFVEESAFGEDSVREVKSSKKDFVITGASKEPYIWDSEDTITKVEFATCVEEREVYLATLKKRKEEYDKSKSSPNISTTEDDEFKF